VFDAGATGNPTSELLIGDNLKYMCRMELNQSDVTNHQTRNTPFPFLAFMPESFTMKGFYQHLC
jgi:hypothetical protein